MDKDVENCYNKKMHQPLFILFGSRASAHATENSDYDVAVFASHAFSFAEKEEYIKQAARLLGVSEDNIDLVDAFSVPPLLQYEIATGGSLFSGDADDFYDFIFRAWKNYQDTARFRRARRAMLAEQYL